MGFEYLFATDGNGRVYSHYGKQLQIIKSIIFLQTDVDYKTIDGTWVVGASANYNQGTHLYNSTAAQNDAFALTSFYLPEEIDCDLYAVVYKHTDAPKIHVFLDGADVGSIDCYTAGGADNNVAVSLDLGTLSAGVHSIYLKLSDKNASSTGYVAHIQNIFILRD